MHEFASQWRDSVPGMIVVLMNRTVTRTFAILFTAATLACLTRGGAAERMTVHEWGTFTSVQNEDGEALPGINIDDEPVPSFVSGRRPCRAATRT